MQVTLIVWHLLTRRPTAVSDQRYVFFAYYNNEMRWRNEASFRQFNCYLQVEIYFLSCDATMGGPLRGLIRHTPRIILNVLITLM